MVLVWPLAPGRHVSGTLRAAFHKGGIGRLLGCMVRIVAFSSVTVRASRIRHGVCAPGNCAVSTLR